MSDIKPDPRFAHSAGSGGDTPNPADDAKTTDDHEGVHANTRETTEGVEENAQDVERPRHGAELPAADLPNPGV
jgi:hypothetical protein